MGVLEALGGWQNVNQEKLEQIKVDNPSLYDAISKALNLLAKKYGGEDIIIQKPIEVVEEVVPANQQGKLTDYQILKKIEILNFAKGDWSTRSEILESFINEIGFDENEIGAIGDFEQDLYSKLDDLVAKDLVSTDYYIKTNKYYNLTYAGQKLIDDYESQNKQVEELQPTFEDLKLEILLRMSDYYDNGSQFNWLNNFDITDGAVKHFVDVPQTMIENIKGELLIDAYIEKGGQGEFRLTNKGYDKAMGWFEENQAEQEEEATTSISTLTEIQKQIIEMVGEEMSKNWKPVDVLYEILAKGKISTTKPVLELNEDLKYLVANKYLKSEGMVFFELDSMGANYLSQKAQKTTTTTTQTPQYNLPQDRLEGILQRLSEAMAKTNDYVTIAELHKQLYHVMVPLNYETYEKGNEPSLEKDLKIMEGMGLVKSRITIDRNTQIIDTEYYIDTKGSEILTQLKLVEAQKQKASSLRPSPSESATLFPTGTIRFGNDGNQWRVTETKNGVKRWTKVGEIPSDVVEPEEIPIEDITEDELDLDILEQQLEDESLQFDIDEDTLDNLEF
jgi:hypothetical protein